MKNASQVVENQAVTVIAQLRENVKRASGNKVKDRKYEILLTGDTKVKMSPQAVTLLEAIFGTNKSEMTEQEIFDLVNTPEVTEKLHTKQSPWKIFQYYRKTMVDAGFLKF